MAVEQRGAKASACVLTDNGASGACGGSDREARARAAVIARLERVLDQRGVPNERLVAWEHRERKAMRRTMPSILSSSGLRMIVVELAWEAVMSIRLKGAQVDERLQVYWFEAMQLMDLGSHAAGLVGDVDDAALIGRMLAQLLAVVMLVVKSDTAEHGVLDTRHLEPLAARASSLSTAHGGIPVTLHDVLNEEGAFFCRAAVYIGVPSVATWLGVVLERFDVATGGLLAPVMYKVRAVALTWAALIVRRVPVCSEYPPSFIAFGICGILLTTTGHIARHALRPHSGFNTVDWNDAFAIVTGSIWAPPSMITQLPPQAAFAALEFAGGCEPEKLQASAGVVLQALMWDLSQAPTHAEV